MPKFYNVPVATYRRKDGTKIKKHVRKVKLRSTESRLKEKHSKAKGALRKATREGAKKSIIDHMKRLVKMARRSSRSVRLGQHKYKHGLKYSQKMQRLKKG